MTAVATAFNRKYHWKYHQRTLAATQSESHDYRARRAHAASAKFTFRVMNDLWITFLMKTRLIWSAENNWTFPYPIIYGWICSVLRLISMFFELFKSSAKIIMIFCFIAICHHHHQHNQHHTHQCLNHQHHNHQYQRQHPGEEDWVPGNLFRLTESADRPIPM